MDKCFTRNAPKIWAFMSTWPFARGLRYESWFESSGDREQIEQAILPPAHPSQHLTDIPANWVAWRMWGQRPDVENRRGKEYAGRSSLEAMLEKPRESPGILLAGGGNMVTFEAGLDGVTFQSKGCKLLGGFYRAAGAGRRPTALLLHGVPGVEKNLDVAYALRDAGWNCLYFHYRGSWGSEGSYSLGGLVDDLGAATEWLLRQPSVDLDRLALVGHSGGGYTALTGGAMDMRFKAIVALCPLISPLTAPLPSEEWSEFARMLRGVTGEELKIQYEALPPVTSKAEQLRSRAILILTGARDDDFPPAHYPPLLAAVPTIEWHEFPDGDHVLSSCRPEAVRRTLDWLIAHLGE